jgi:hypothetical protein
MNTGYSSEELKSLHRILQAAMAEAKTRHLDLSVSGMIGRLFAAADAGERDPIKLKSAALSEDIQHTPSMSHYAPARADRSAPLDRALPAKKPVRRPILTLFPKEPVSMRRLRPG